jgi:hypothetical protein
MPSDPDVRLQEPFLVAVADGEGVVEFASQIVEYLAVAEHRGLVVGLEQREEELGGEPVVLGLRLERGRIRHERFDPRHQRVRVPDGLLRHVRSLRVTGT